MSRAFDQMVLGILRFPILRRFLLLSPSSCVAAGRFEFDDSEPDEWTNVGLSSWRLSVHLLLEAILGGVTVESWGDVVRLGIDGTSSMSRGCALSDAEKPMTGGELLLVLSESVSPEVVLSDSVLELLDSDAHIVSLEISDGVLSRPECRRLLDSIVTGSPGSDVHVLSLEISDGVLSRLECRRLPVCPLRGFFLLVLRLFLAIVSLS